MFFSNPEIIALTFESNFGTAKASSKALTIASSDVHTAFMDSALASSTRLALHSHFNPGLKLIR